MNIRFYEAASAFLSEAQPYLEQAEAANNLMLGLSLRLARATEPSTPTPLFLTAHADDDLALAALMTPPNFLILYRRGHAWENLLQPVAEALCQAGWPLPGVRGPDELPQAFARLWSRLTGRPFYPGMNQRIYELRRVLYWPSAPGRFRVATLADLDLLADWFLAFQAEALPNDHTSPPTFHEMVARKIQEQSLYVWEVAGRVVSLAGWNRPLPHGIAVGPVYTPPDQRGQGYASAVVAHLSQHLLDTGYQFCCLFTDLANPTSNTIYQRLGYAPVCDFNEYFFS